MRRDSSGAPAGRTSRGAGIRDPAVTLVRSAYLTYFRLVLPVLAGCSLGTARLTTICLPQWVPLLHRTEFEKILKNHRFVEVRADPLTLGIVFLYTARKR